jgi:hypothetical protein
MPVLRLATGDMVRRLESRPSCELAGLPATSPLLGRANSSPASQVGPVYQRQILELLEGQTEIPLPARYSLRPVTAGLQLNVLIDQPDPELQRRLEDEILRRRLPIVDVVLNCQLDTMPKPEFARALLRETVVVRDERSGSWSLR